MTIRFDEAAALALADAYRTVAGIVNDQAAHRAGLGAALYWEGNARHSFDSQFAALQQASSDLAASFLAAAGSVDGLVAEARRIRAREALEAEERRRAAARAGDPEPV